MTSTAPTAAAIALKEGEGEALWFLDSLAVIKATGEQTAGSVAVIEFLAPRGSGSPLHVHHNEDEWFYVIEGELTLWVDGTVIDAPTGSFVFGPRDLPHTFTVASDEARFLLVTEPGAFSEFVRAVSVPAESRAIPPAAIPRPDPERMAAIAGQFGLEILGPPGIPD
jgi:quercetin dioxygenase-like cupin family protein